MLKNSKKTFLLLIGIFLLVFINVNVLQAEGGIVPCTGSDCDTNDIFTLINNALKVLFPILNAIAFALIVWGGINIITAEGKDEKVRKGKEIILAVGMGILIIYGAKLILTSFVGGLGGENQMEWFNNTIHMPQEK